MNRKKTSRHSEKKAAQMANTDVINLIMQTVGEMVVYMLPVIALLSGLMFVFSFLIHVTINSVKKW